MYIIEFALVFLLYEEHIFLFPESILLEKELLLCSVGAVKNNYFSSCIYEDRTRQYLLLYNIKRRGSSRACLSIVYVVMGSSRDLREVDLKWGVLGPLMQFFTLLSSRAFRSIVL